MIVYKEVKQFKGEWKLVMEKLAKVGSVVVNVGNMCRNHGLNVEDLPSDLFAMFGSFQRCVLLLLNMSWSNSKQATCMGLMPRWKNVLKWKESIWSFFVTVYWGGSGNMMQNCRLFFKYTRSVGSAMIPFARWKRFCRPTWTFSLSSHNSLKN